MDFNFKSYQMFKLKKYLKKNDLFFLFHSAKLNLVKWTNVEQNLKKLKLNYYKPLNSITNKIFKNSVYRNFITLVNGFILFIDLNYKTTKLDPNLMIKNLKSNFSLISIKLNNRIYSLAQLKGIKQFSYKQNNFNLYKVLNKQLKTSYILTQNKK